MASDDGKEKDSVHVGPQGRIVIPARLRQELRLEVGEALVAYVEEDRLIMERPQTSLSRLQRAFRAAVPEGVSLADELLADRRAEARREESG